MHFPETLPNDYPLILANSFANDPSKIAFCGKNDPPSNLPSCRRQMKHFYDNP